jgi:hypothetical protein
MGYNRKCTDQNCTQGCCNTYGNCPTSSGYSSSLSSRCKYYYTDQQPLDAGATAGVAVGALVGFALFIIILVCCIIKCCQRKAAQQAAANIANKHNNKNSWNATNHQLTTEYADPNQIILQNQQPYGQTYGQPFAQPYGQPYIQQAPMQQPMYGSPEQALFGQNQPPVFPGLQANNAPGLYGPSPIIQ